MKLAKLQPLKPHTFNKDKSVDENIEELIQKGIIRVTKMGAFKYNNTYFVSKPILRIYISRKIEK